MIDNESTIRLEAVRCAAWYCLQKEIGRRGGELARWMLAGLACGLLGGLAWGII